MRARSLLLAASLAPLAAPAARADVRIDGHGYGHGVGLSQYGAYGYARDEGRDSRWILAHYYAGTQIGRVATGRIRVRLKAAAALRVASAVAARAAGRRVKLTAGRTYRFSPSGSGLRVTDLKTGRTRARLTVPVRLSPRRTPLRLFGKAENGVKDGRYRGALLLAREGAKVLAVEDAGLEDYLLGVVASEMPASWSREALRAQAVAARSYALRSKRPTAPFDVYADTRSQAYRGVTGEAAATTAAVRATRGQAVLAAGQVAQTLFHASSGGVTAAVQEVFLASPPISYLLSADDPYDRLSPYHDWTATFKAADVAQRLGVPGALTGLTVTASTPTGRVRTVHATGTLGAIDLDGPTVQARLGLRSTWFAISTVGAATAGRRARQNPS